MSDKVKKKDQYLSIRIEKILREKIVAMAQKENRSMANMVDVILKKAVGYEQ